MNKTILIFCAIFILCSCESHVYFTASAHVANDAGVDANSDSGEADDASCDSGDSALTYLVDASQLVCTLEASLPASIGASPSK